MWLGEMSNVTHRDSYHRKDESDGFLQFRASVYRENDAFIYRDFAGGVCNREEYVKIMCSCRRKR